jgi:hypothetical protein
MVSKTKQHEREYFHIRKETLEIIGIVLFWIIIGGVLFTFGCFFGHTNGYNEGWTDKWEETVRLVNENGHTHLVNSDGTLNMTLEKEHSCNFFTPYLKSDIPYIFMEDKNGN